jgi:hypothetical protein
VLSEVAVPRSQVTRGLLWQSSLVPHLLNEEMHHKCSEDTCDLVN